jgi:hypothetical protein
LTKATIDRPLIETVLGMSVKGFNSRAYILGVKKRRFYVKQVKKKTTKQKSTKKEARHER